VTEQHTSTEADLVVLQSFPTPRPTTNPYVIMLAESLRAVAGVTVQNFSWRTALAGKYDVFHVHWPEILVSGQNPAKKLARQGLFVGLILRLKAKDIPIVRTVHNLELPSGISRREVALLKWAQRATTLQITLNRFTPTNEDEPHEVILHGHYKDWFANYPVPSPQRGFISYFGFVRRYKGVDSLIEAFKALPRNGPLGALRLVIAGAATNQATADELFTAAGVDERIALEFHFLSDDGLVNHVGHSELIVLPYRHIHNSGGVLTALSLNRPVLVPANEANDGLSEEVGPGWVWTYEGDLTGEAITTALIELRAGNWTPEPDLSQRAWPQAARAHVGAYRRAISLLRGERTSP